MAELPVVCRDVLCLFALWYAVLLQYDYALEEQQMYDGLMDAIDDHEKSKSTGFEFVEE